MFFWPDHPAFQTGLDRLKGVGPKTLAILNQAGLYSTGDLLARAPRFYQDRRRISTIGTLEDGGPALVAARVVSARAAFSRRRRRYLTAQVEDSSGRLTLLWFNAPAYLLKSLFKGRPVFLFGQARLGDRGPEMIHPDLEFPSKGEEDGFPPPSGRGLHPVYAPIGSLTSSQVARLQAQALGLLAGCPGPPEDWLARHNLPDPVRALETVHCPPADFSGPPPRPEDSRAFAALAFWELLFWRLMMLRARENAAGEAVRTGGWAEGQRALEGFWGALPFAPSSEQRRVVEEILDDLKNGRPLSRLLQGEVGGGKTAVAGALIFFTLGQGSQAALMAPTEVLARQHFEFLAGPAAALGYTAALLAGGQSGKEKKEVRRALAEGRIDLIVGTQALAAAGTGFRNLGLAVIDEQHRFGVRQRLMLRRKDQRVGLLCLSATPIPRSLALMLYGDLNHSRLAGLLPGRCPPQTELWPGNRRGPALVRFLELLGDGQGFVVAPRIGEKSGAPDPEDQAGPLSLEETHRELAALAGPGVSLARLHGRLPAAEQESIVEDFRRGRIQVLLATSIIEVGVDVPAARVILIDGADHFGLAQLHQLRGRVGRDGREAHCLLLPGVEPTAQGRARLLALSRETDGQVLAELDLQLRGPGEELGLRQSGWPALNFARLPRDLALLERARQLAEHIWAGGESAPPGWTGQDPAVWPSLDYPETVMD